MVDSLMDALGYVGDTLNKPGRAVRGLLGGRPDEAAAILPFSDTIGLTDPSRQVSGRDLLSQLGLDPGDGIGGTLAGMGVEALTDPTTYLGAGLGRFAGKAADAAQLAKGPGYSTGAGDLASMLGSYTGGDAARAGRRVDDILRSPNSSRLLSEIPEGSQILGSGAEALAFKTPSNDVLRIGGVLDNAAPGRPISPDVLQASRTVGVDGPRPFRVDRTPLADKAPANLYGGYEGMVDDALGPQGLKYADRNSGNLGLVGGRPVVVDPGAVDATSAFAGGFQPVTQAADPSGAMKYLLSALGGDAALQRSLAAGGNSPGLANKLTAYGAAAGALPGRFGG